MSQTWRLSLAGEYNSFFYAHFLRADSGLDVVMSRSANNALVCFVSLTEGPDIHRPFDLSELIMHSSDRRCPICRVGIPPGEGRFLRIYRS